MGVKGKTYNQLAIAFKKGTLDPYDALKDYKRILSAAMKQVRAIEKSDVPFTTTRPRFPTITEITSTEDLLHAIADINRFTESKEYKLKDRRATRDKAIETLHEHGLDFVNVDNYNEYVDFMRWFYGNNLNKMYGSQEDVVEEFFRDKWDKVSSYKTNSAKKGALTNFAKTFME